MNTGSGCFFTRIQSQYLFNTCTNKPENTANCNLLLKDNCYVGEMNNTDGRVLKMSICQPETVTNGYVQTKQGSDLRLRSDPSEEAKIIAGIPNGATVTILESKDVGWLQIKVSTTYTLLSNKTQENKT